MGYPLSRRCITVYMALRVVMPDNYPNAMQLVSYDVVRVKHGLLSQFDNMAGLRVMLFYHLVC